jgi:predicted DNA binding CopG/RHH family protein
MRHLHRRVSTNEIARVAMVKDFLPSPETLVRRDDMVKVTVSLSKKSVDFFKRQAKKQKVPYQRMIRSLVDKYAERFSENG